MIDLDTAQNHLDKWLNADLALSKGQTVQIDGMLVTRFDTTEKIAFWERKVSAAKRPGGRGYKVGQWA